MSDNDKDDIFVYKTMSVAFRTAFDKLLNDYTVWINDKEVKTAVIRMLMYRVEEADNYIKLELAKEANKNVSYETN